MQATLEIRSNVAAVAMEEVIPMGVSDTTVLTPGEVFRPDKKDFKVCRLCLISERNETYGVAIGRDGNVTSRKESGTAAAKTCEAEEEASTGSGSTHGGAGESGHGKFTNLLFAKGCECLLQGNKHAKARALADLRGASGVKIVQGNEDPALQGKSRSTALFQQLQVL